MTVSCEYVEINLLGFTCLWLPVWFRKHLGKLKEWL
jgi:hypothetical protein